MTAQRATILIVDDDVEIINILKDHFKERNCETIATADPSTVVDKLKNFSVKLMLLDLKMQKIDGFEVLNKVKQAGLMLPPTIIITGFLPKYKDALSKHGISENDVVTKPFHFDVMEKCINRKLGQQIVVSEVGSEYESKIYGNNRCRLGFVEDETDIIEDLSELFEERNYKVHGFRTGVEALEGLKKEQVDILFVDIKLPGMQGDELIEAVSKLPQAPHIVPMSTDPLSSDMSRKFKDLKCGKFLEKPFDLVQLIEQVKTLAIEKKLLG